MVFVETNLPNPYKLITNSEALNISEIKGMWNGLPGKLGRGFLDLMIGCTNIEPQEKAAFLRNVYLPGLQCSVLRCPTAVRYEP
jgi:hypothetical protein